MVRWLQTDRSEDRPKYKCKEEIEEKIDAYFKECEGEILKDEEGKPIFDKFGQPVIINQKPPTVTGLALAWVYDQVIPDKLPGQKGIHEHDYACKDDDRGIHRRKTV